MKEGKAAIEAVISFKDGNGSTTGEYPVTTEIEVKEIALDSIAFDKVIKEMLVGATDTLQVIYNPNPDKPEKFFCISSKFQVQ
ncbi:MAG: hypothetical protein K1W34_14280 [Lachnospiraceae bacterium]